MEGNSIAPRPDKQPDARLPEPLKLGGDFRSDVAASRVGFVALRMILLAAGGIIACAGRQPIAGNSAGTTAASPAGMASPSTRRVIGGRPAIQVMPAGCAPPGLKFPCSPVTNAGCDGPRGEACDDDQHDGFGCYPAPNTVDQGGTCNEETGPACRGGLGCDTGDDDDPDGRCHKYCCSDADCGGKRCEIIDKSFGTLGFCS